MGKNNSIYYIIEIIPTGDWEKKYNFEGKLVVVKCNHLVTQLKVEMATGNQKKEKNIRREWLYKLQP